MRRCAAQLRCLFAIRIRFATDCAELRNAPADPSRGQGMSPSYVWLLKCTVGSYNHVDGCLRQRCPCGKSESRSRDHVVRIIDWCISHRGGGESDSHRDVLPRTGPHRTRSVRALTHESADRCCHDDRHKRLDEHRGWVRESFPLRAWCRAESCSNCLVPH